MCFSFHTVWKVVLGVMGTTKGGSEVASSNSLYFWNAESGFVMCSLCQGRQKMSEQVRVGCWAACQLSPFAVTRHPVWHYSGSLWVVSSPLSFGKTCIFPRHHVSWWRVHAPKLWPLPPIVTWSLKVRVLCGSDVQHSFLITPFSPAVMIWLSLPFLGDILLKEREPWVFCG